MTDSLKDVVADMREHIKAMSEIGIDEIAMRIYLDRLSALAAPMPWEVAMKLASQAVNDTDGRGMIGNSRRHLVERVARAIMGSSIAALSPGRSGEVAPKLREMDYLEEQDDRDLEDWLGGRS